MIDPMRVLVHDHGDIDRRVVEIDTLFSQPSGMTLATKLGELCDVLFVHFAREEEALFPFVVEALPELQHDVRAMELAHDVICGALARACELSRAGEAGTTVERLFRRFQNAYAEHARVELAVLQAVEHRLDGRQRARLATLVAGV
jgi:hypothetical protein